MSNINVYIPDCLKTLGEHKMTNIRGGLRGLVYGGLATGGLVLGGCQRGQIVRQEVPSIPKQQTQQREQITDDYPFEGIEEKFTLRWEDDDTKRKVQLGVVFQNLADGKRDEKGNFVNVKTRDYFTSHHPMVKYGSSEVNPLKVSEQDSDRFLRRNFDRFVEQVVPDWYKDAVRERKAPTTYENVEPQKFETYTEPVAVK
jgi:hypothetical protein